MKALILLAFLAITNLVNAQTSTVVVVSPQRPINCQVEDSQLVNWVYDLKNVYEDSDEAQIKFRTMYGRCYGGRSLPQLLNYSAIRAYAFQNSFLWPWQKDGVKTDVSFSTDLEAIVTMTFNKRIIFKKKLENHLSFYFEPGLLGPIQYFYGPYGQVRWSQTTYQFPWNVDVYLDGEILGNNSMRIQIR